jgi:PAS domain S-box-containing protein
VVTADERRGDDSMALALDAASMCVWDWDLARGALAWSENFRALYGREPESFGGTFDGYLRTCVHERDRERLGERFALARTEGADFRIDFRAVMPDGETRCFEHVGRVAADERGRPVRLLGVTLDRTERQRREDELHASEQRFRVLVESATEYAIFTLDSDNRVTSWNTGAERITGYERDEILGRSGDLLFTEEDRARRGPERELERALARGRSVNERWHVRKDGSLFFGSGFVEPLRDGSGEAGGFVKIMRDNTDRQRAEAERAELLAREQAARAEAESANRAKDEFLAIVSHELRTPLNAMLGWAQILRHKFADDPETAKALETIERNAHVQRRLVEDVLDLSRIVSGTLAITTEPVELAAVVGTAVDSVEDAARRKGVALVTSVGAAVGPVLADADRLAQVFGNLLSNAIKFTPKGGRVEIELLRSGARARVEVRDTGAGIEPDFLPHVFDRFRQADSSTTRRHGGLGLGLAIVRRLVDLHEGTVRLESEGAGRGTTAVVELPLLEAEQREPEPLLEDSSEGDATARLDGVHVLLVDDDPDALVLFATTLGERGALVRTAGSARDAVEAFERERPSVLVSDVGMPEMDGYELIRRVREIEGEPGAWTPAIAVTAYAGGDVGDLALDAGFHEYLAKPVAAAELVRAVARLAGRDGV